MALNSHAQLFEWGIGFHGFVDNREYAESGRFSQTITGLRIAPRIGFLVDSTHRIQVGASLLSGFGTQSFIDQADPIIYYQYHKPTVDFYMGMIPREETIGRFSNALLNDTMAYSDPNMGGILVHYHHGKVQQRLWLDWESAPGIDKREQFRVGAKGSVRWKHFYLEHQMMLWHYALAQNSNPDQHIRDNLALQVMAGYQRSSANFIDSLEVSGGVLFSLDRIRNVYDWSTPLGGVVHLYAKHKSLFVENELYIGEEQDIPNGVNFYMEKTYNRLDLGWAPLRNARLNAALIFRFHFTPTGMDNQQVLSLRYRIGNRFPLRFSAD